MLTSENRWLVILFAANVLITLGFVISLKTTYVFGPIWFSLVFYITIGYLLFNKKKIVVFQKEPALKKIKDAEALILLNKLKKLMEKEKLYKKSNLKLNDVAKELNITSNRLSQLLNENIGKSFTLFLNEYRIKEAKQLLINYNKFTIEAIGYEAGFSSKSSFFCHL
ncbi:helix-turn-helix domain-containing protein [Tenacibaculum adriaticum]|nr:helix-turn-helix domain-containing protein [Tenacibaculum adriaticum]